MERKDPERMKQKPEDGGISEFLTEKSLYYFKLCFYFEAASKI